MFISSRKSLFKINLFIIVIKTVCHLPIRIYFKANCQLFDIKSIKVKLVLFRSSGQWYNNMNHFSKSWD